VWSGIIVVIDEWDSVMACKYINVGVLGHPTINLLLATFYKTTPILARQRAPRATAKRSGE
jgi:hypothetical protein